MTSPPSPQNLQGEVSGDLAGLFLVLALISLLIGAVGIANTTLVAVLERTEEIGLRRAVGARPRHIAAAQDGPLAGIQTLSNDIFNDVLKDSAVKSATSAWAGCMARNGYSYRQPQDVFFQGLTAMYGEQRPINAGEPVSAAANQAQIAAAVTDATCSQSADLAGIYFAVQASYEQQLVNANAQALTAAVRRYRAAYARELSRLSALLRTAKAMPFPGTTTRAASAALELPVSGAHPGAGRRPESRAPSSVTATIPAANTP